MKYSLKRICVQVKIYAYNPIFYLLPIRFLGILKKKKEKKSFK